jgi:hypothetical protein
VTRRQARRSLGSRTTRRAGTKSKVIPRSNGKKPTKFRYPRRTKARVAVLVARKLKEVAK